MSDANRMQSALQTACKVLSKTTERNATQQNYLPLQRRLSYLTRAGGSENAQ